MRPKLWDTSWRDLQHTCDGGTSLCDKRAHRVLRAANLVMQTKNPREDHAGFDMDEWRR